MVPGPPWRAAPTPAAHSQGTAPAQAKDRVWLHLLLFALSLASTTYAGMTMWGGRFLLYEEVGWQAWLADGLRYALPLIGFLTVHEFGHYFAARAHSIRTSLPYFIPFPFNGIGNFGAVIRIREPLPSTRSLFDVGVAGPVAGFVVAAGVIAYAVATLPPPEYLLDVPGHEALKEHIRATGTFSDARPDPDEGTMLIVVGQTPLFWMLSQVVPHMPPMHEIYHYPVLFAGWLALFFTALNLLPVGQLDGGHVLYALFGRRWHGRLARAFLLLLLASGSVGFMTNVPSALAGVEALPAFLAFPTAVLLLALILGVYLYRIFGGDVRYVAGLGLGLGALTAGALATGEALTSYGYTGWLVWTALIVFLIRTDHPPVVRAEPLTPARRALGYAAIVIFILCFSIRPLVVL